MKKHQDWSGKYCPHRILGENRWESFKQRIQAELNKLKQPVSNAKYELVEEEGSKTWCIQSGKFASKDAAIQEFEKSWLSYATIKGTVE